MTFTTQNSIKIGTVDCFDLSTEETFDQFDTLAVRKFACKWSDRLALINALNPRGTQIGPVYVFESLAHPEIPSLYPQRFRTKCYPGSTIVKAPSGMVGYDMCELTAEYRPFRGGDAQGYLEFDLGANVITMPGSGSWLETDPDDGSASTAVPLQDCARGYPVPTIGVVRGRSNVAGLNVGKIVAASKAPLNINSFYGFPPGTVLFEGCRARRQTLTNVGSGVGSGPGNGNTATPQSLLDGAWDIECRFLARPGVPWDHLPFRKETPTGSMLFGADKIWKFVIEKVRLANGQGPYLGRSDLNALFS